MEKSILEGINIAREKVANDLSTLEKSANIGSAFKGMLGKGKQMVSGAAEFAGQNKLPLALGGLGAAAGGAAGFMGGQNIGEEAMYEPIRNLAIQNYMLKNQLAELMYGGGMMPPEGGPMPPQGGPMPPEGA